MSQIVSVDCVEMFSHVVKSVTIGTILTISFSKSWPIHQLDVHNSFVHGDLHKNMCMRQLFDLYPKEISLWFEASNLCLVLELC